MSNENTESKLVLAKIPDTIPATIQSKFNVALTNYNLQKMADKASAIVYNEDHLKEIKELLEEVKAAEKKIEEAHKIGKQPSLTEGKNWDLAKNTFLQLALSVKQIAQPKYVQICADIDRRATQQRLEQERVARVKNSIEQNAVWFSQKIAACETKEELTALESKINLEKTRKEKYEEFLEVAVERFTQLNALLKSQKEKVKEMEALKKKEGEALASGDDQAVMDIAEQKEVLSQSIDEGRVLVQEAAADQSIFTNDAPLAQTVFPTVKARRSVWKWEVKDIAKTQKQMPTFVQLVTVDDKIDEYLKAKKAEGIDKNTEEFEFAGIRFFLEKTY